MEPARVESHVEINIRAHKKINNVDNHTLVTPHHVRSVYQKYKQPKIMHKTSPCECVRERGGGGLLRSHRCP